MKTPTSTPGQTAKSPTAPLLFNIHWLHLIWAVLLIGIGIGLFLLKQQNTQILLQQQTFNAAQQNRQEEGLTLKALIGAQTEQINKQQQRLLQLEMRFRQQNDSSYLSLTRTLEEAAYLLNTADLYLNVNQDAPAATELLKLVKQRLDVLANPQLLSVKRAVNQDLSELSRFSPMDMTQTIIGLNSINDNARHLKPFIPPKIATEENDIKTSQSTKIPQTWYQKTLASLADLKKFIIIRRTSDPIKPLLTSTELDLLQQNILLSLMEARTAVLTKNKTLYVHSLEQLREQLKFYPPQNDLTTIQNLLDKLIQIDVNPKIPTNLQASINAINQALNQHQLNNNSTTSPLDTSGNQISPDNKSALPLPLLKPANKPAPSTLEI